MNDKEFEQAIARVTCSVWGPSMGRRMNQRDIKQRQQIASLKAELDAVLAMVSMLEEKEWAEHAGRGPISNRLEACITELHGEISEAHEAAPPAAAHGDEAEPSVDFAAWLIDHREGQVVTEEDMHEWLGEWYEQRLAMRAQAGEGGEV